MSNHFADPYYSLQDGLAETRHVFLNGNGLPERFRPGFHIAELGFGTGLNLLVALQAARAAGALPLHYTGFEAFPMHPPDMRRALDAFPSLGEDADRLVAAWASGPRWETDDVVADIVLGDARETVPRWDGLADAWFLDGFAPARNPDLWDRDLLCAVGRRTRTGGGTAATYSAAGQVRRDLAAAGFEVSRVAGYGRKRHMTIARMP